MSPSHVSYLTQTQQMSTKVEEKWLDAGPHYFMTETCSSCRSFNPSMEEMPFQPPSSASMRRQLEPCSPPASAGTFHPHLHCCLRFFFFPDMYPPRFSSRCRYFSPFPAWPLPPRWALLLGACFPGPCCIQQRGERWVGKPYKRREATVHRLLGEPAEAIRSPKPTLLV